MDMDIVIVGGGIAGISAAAALAPQASVTLLEAEQGLAYHASGRSAAMFIRGYGNATIREMNAISADEHREADVLMPRPVMLVAKDDMADAFERDLAELGMDRIGPDEARALLPILAPDVTLAAAEHGSADIDTDLLVQHYRRIAMAADARIVTGSRITDISREDGAWVLRWPGGEVRARHLVNAAGAWADETARLAGATPLGLQPYRRSMARIAGPGGRDTRAWPFCFSAGEAWYCKPDAGALLVSPGEEDPMDPFDAWPDDMVLAEGLARYEEHVTEPVTRPIATWAGLRTFAPDRTPVIGPDPETPDFWWLAGQGGYGFQIAPAAARVLKGVMNGGASDLASLTASLSPRRLAG
ncbi:putative FAD-dependent glycerol-3-phosphate dehydrogenase protein [Oceaniovalibus guishaninsula JLT2003]|uniref:Putative FAD-dependent glycerol-3-phosphate dehydrogenase protein n=1 Tax=Oceaniovalibus guishaninsula JLT2003 TaxID=1231392 RepID=K2HM68_9RHOB|nr:FAD-dependent oxidoreductase [Oceaniovalibus guishaninsula]EKE43979.1 putative FAD-dependent glycerol-3-phosphate dehydrogenase protein [Oceaniovalibus guishaninsula JLT2003]